MLAYVVCNIIQKKKLEFIVLLYTSFYSELRHFIHHNTSFLVNFLRECCYSNGTLFTRTALKYERPNAKIHEQFNTSLLKVINAKK